jgi:hypothetical protein
MAPQPTLYKVQPGSKPDQLAVERLWTQSGSAPLAAGYGHLFPLSAGGGLYLVGVDEGSGKAAAFRIQASDPWFVPVASHLDLQGRWDLIEPFVLGNEPHLLAYTAAKGNFSFFPIGADLTAQPPYTYQRVREPGITADFTVTQPIVINGSVFILCYGGKTGKVNLYSLAVTATPAAGTPPGTPALIAQPVWVHEWARNWTRFAFFQLGGENFFFKTNTGKLNVNIDHVLDDPSRGTVEVGTHLDLPHALDIDIVESFYLNGGDPYFLTYVKDGSATCNRFHGDCQGWTLGASLRTVDGATRIVPYQLGNETYALFY